MPNIDVSTIEGFEAMTPEDKVEALLKVEIPEKIDLAQYVSKETSNNLASENKKLKDQLKAQMSEDQRAAAERDAKWAEMEAKIAQLEREKLESSFKASFLAMGYDEELAVAAAKAKVEGDAAKEFDIQRRAMEAAMKNLKAELVKSTPKPDGAGGGDVNVTPKNIELAKKLGQRRHQSQSASDEILKHYMK